MLDVMSHYHDQANSIIQGVLVNAANRQAECYDVAVIMQQRNLVAGFGIFIVPISTVLINISFGF